MTNAQLYHVRLNTYTLEEVRQKADGFSYLEQQMAEGKKKLLRRKFFDRVWVAFRRKAERSSIVDYSDMILYQIDKCLRQILSILGLGYRV